MSTGYGWEGLRLVCATLLGARHVPERRCNGLYRLLGPGAITTNDFPFFNFRCFRNHLRSFTCMLLYSAYCRQLKHNSYAIENKEAQLTLMLARDSHAGRNA